MLMEEIILENYYDSILRSVRGLNWNDWEGLYRDVLDVFDKKPEDLKGVLKNYVYHKTDEPLKDILEFIIRSFISETHPGILWEGIIEIKSSYQDTPYDTKIRYMIIVYPKESVISVTPPLWIWEHHSEVEEFMGDTEFYGKINKLAGKYVEI